MISTEEKLEVTNNQFRTAREKIIMTPINKVSRNIKKYDISELYNSIAEECNFRAFNDESKNKFINIVNESLKKTANPIFIHGKQTEKMFSYVVSCMPECVLIKQEDAGFLFSNDRIKIPDYRVLLKNKSQMLIEVKNHHTKNKLKKYQIKTDELQELNNYAYLMQTELKIAIYWSNLQVWTLVCPDKFINNGNKSYIDFKTAIENNEMSILGDYWLATTPPLELRMHVKEKELLPNRIDGFISKVELYANNNLIVDQHEKSIAFNLILFGSWQDDLYVETINNSRCIVSTINPIQKSNEQFDMIGAMSSIISRKFKYLTSNIQDLTPVPIKIKSENLFIDIDIENYKGKVLQLWRFHVEKKSN